jgi:Metallo-beta-lactamase superfamily
VRGEPAEVADGVLVIPDGRVPLVPNVGFVIGDHAVLVIDTGVGPRNGAYVLEHARRLAGGRPVYLTTTHFHPEHGFGAQVFKDQATIIYNRPQRDELHRKGAAYIEMFKGLGPDIAAEIAGVELTDVSLIRDVRDYLHYVRSQASRLRASGASADDAAAAIEQEARARWGTWANPEWIGYAARAFYLASPPLH